MGRETIRSNVSAFGEADVQTFCRIFDRLSKDGISDPAELYRKGIMEYLEYGNNERKDWQLSQSVSPLVVFGR